MVPVLPVVLAHTWSVPLSRFYKPDWTFVSLWTERDILKSLLPVRLHISTGDAMTRRRVSAVISFIVPTVAIDDVRPENAAGVPAGYGGSHGRCWV